MFASVDDCKTMDGEKRFFGDSEMSKVSAMEEIRRSYRRQTQFIRLFLSTCGDC